MVPSRPDDQREGPRLPTPYSAVDSMGQSGHGVSRHRPRHARANDAMADGRHGPPLLGRVVSFTRPWARRRLSVEVERELGPRLEPGEHVSNVFAVFCGSLALDMLAYALAAGGMGLASDHASSWKSFAWGFLAFVPAAWAGRRFLKPHILVLTDRRLFLFRTTWFRERLDRVVVEERREAVSAVWEERDRVTLLGPGGHGTKVRLPLFYRKTASCIADWLGPAEGG